MATRDGGAPAPRPGSPPPGSLVADRDQRCYRTRGWSAVRRRRRCGRVRSPRDERLLDGVRTVHQRQRHALPRVLQQSRRSSTGCRVRDGVPAHRAPPRPDAPQGSSARFLRDRRPRRTGTDDVEPHVVRVRPAVRHPLRPVAVPRRVFPHRHRHPQCDLGGRSSRRVRRQADRQPRAALDRGPQLRLVPVPLADLSGHPPIRRSRPHRDPVRARDGVHRPDHRVELSVDRDADPPAALRPGMAWRPQIPGGDSPPASAPIGPARGGCGIDARLCGSQHRGRAQRLRR